VACRCADANAGNYLIAIIVSDGGGNRCPDLSAHVDDNAAGEAPPCR
jgi:hypothetical protein